MSYSACTDAPRTHVATAPVTAHLVEIWLLETIADDPDFPGIDDASFQHALNKTLADVGTKLQHGEPLPPQIFAPTCDWMMVSLVRPRSGRFELLVIYFGPKKEWPEYAPTLHDVMEAGMVPAGSFVGWASGRTLEFERRMPPSSALDARSAAHVQTAHGRSADRDGDADDGAGREVITPQSPHSQTAATLPEPRFFLNDRDAFAVASPGVSARLGSALGAPQDIETLYCIECGATRVVANPWACDANGIRHNAALQPTDRREAALGRYSWRCVQGKQCVDAEHVSQESPMAMHFEDDGDFQPMGTDFPGGACIIKVIAKRYVVDQRSIWTVAMEKAFVGAIDAVVKEVARRLHVGADLGRTFTEPADGYLLYGDIIQREGEIILAILFFDAGHDEDDIGFPVDAGIYDPLPKVARYITYPNGDGFVVERLSASAGEAATPRPPEPVLQTSPALPATPAPQATLGPEVAAVLHVSIGGVRAEVTGDVLRVVREDGARIAVDSLAGALAGLETCRDVDATGVDFRVSADGTWVRLRGTVLDDVHVEITGAGTTQERARRADAPSPKTGSRPRGSEAATAAPNLLGNASPAALLAGQTVDAERPARDEAGARLVESAAATARPGAKAEHLCGRADIAGTSASARIVGRNIPEIDAAGRRARVAPMGRSTSPDRYPLL